MISTILLLLVLADNVESGAFGFEEKGSGQATELKTPDLVIGKVPDQLPGMRGTFQQYLSVFGVHVLATKGVPADKVRHVGAVLAEYLDNDEDGKVDNPEVVEAMTARVMAMVIFRSEREMERLDRSEIERYGYRYLQGQFAGETAPPGEFDATLEEVLHLVTVGFSEAYPRIFGTVPGTSLSDCLDRARGGRFGSVPRRYPEKAWFHYDDRTCDYSCMGGEYLYWALTSLLGAQDKPERVRQIAHEWELTSAELVKEKDPWITALLEDPQYHWARKLPDGHYDPAEIDREKASGNGRERER